jgi:hypothetical protein
MGSEMDNSSSSFSCENCFECHKGALVKEKEHYNGIPDEKEGMCNQIADTSLVSRNKDLIGNQ